MSWAHRWRHRLVSFHYGEYKSMTLVMCVCKFIHLYVLEEELRVHAIFNSPDSPSVKLKPYSELVFCLGKKKKKGKLVMVFGDDKREF